MDEGDSYCKYHHFAHLLNAIRSPSRVYGRRAFCSMFEAVLHGWLLFYIYMLISTFFTAKSKKQRRAAARAALKAAKANPEALIPKVPIEHQSIDLPAGDGTIKGAITALRAREELRDAMRKGRRKSIKEGNFLKAMR